MRADEACVQGGQSAGRVAAAMQTPEPQASSYLQQKHLEETDPLDLTPWILL